MTSAREAAVDAMADILRRFPGFEGDFATVARKEVAGDILDALLSPTKKPCATCGGKGEHQDVDPEGWTRSTDCETCHHSGFVLGPAPIEGLGWVKVSDCEPITVSNDDGAGGQFVDAEGNYESHDRPATRRVIGFRLPSKVREG